MEHLLAQPSVYEDEAKMQQLNEAYSKIQEEEAALNKKWEDLAEQIESLQN